MRHIVQPEEHLYNLSDIYIKLTEAEGVILRLYEWTTVVVSETELIVAEDAKLKV